MGLFGRRDTGGKSGDYSPQGVCFRYSKTSTVSLFLGNSTLFAVLSLPTVDDYLLSSPDCSLIRDLHCD